MLFQRPNPKASLRDAVLHFEIDCKLNNAILVIFKGIALSLCACRAIAPLSPRGCSLLAGQAEHNRTRRLREIYAIASPTFRGRRTMILICQITAIKANAFRESEIRKFALPLVVLGRRIATFRT